AAGLALEQARTQAAQAASRRTELVEALENAAAEEQAGMDGLGPCRLAHADAERELERLADTAALGSDPAARSIAKATDAVETAASIVAAHERRVRVLAAKREQAEQVLEQHDQVTAIDEQKARERHLDLVGALVDQRLSEATAAAIVFRDLMTSVRV